MSIINAVITSCVGLVLLAGAAMTYHSREVDRQLVQKAEIAARADMANARASLSKFDDKRY
jgi:hypothetical protein